MSHHTIIARLGDGDTIQPVLSRLQTQTTQINFLKGNGRMGFGLGQALKGLSELGLTPSETSVDLALLAATVTAADISRGKVDEYKAGGNAFPGPTGCWPWTTIQQCTLLFC